MCKILMRANMSPLKQYTVAEVLHKDLIGSNMGNMLFPYSIMNNLMTDDVEIDTISRFKSLSIKRIEGINRTYDFFLVPLANAFRSSFLEDLDDLSKFIEQLKIPAIVIGVGLQKKATEAMKDTVLCESVKRFMNATLERSSMVGVRGGNTADYLKMLGYKPEIDFTVIGCPSMYLYGDKLPENNYLGLTFQSKLSMNSKVQLKQPLHDFLYRTKQQFTDCCYVPQVIEEIRHMYYGTDSVKLLADKIPKHFPMEFGTDYMKQWKAVSFVHPEAWLDYLRERDFSVGSRIHGNIAAILAGTPCFIVVSDKRIEELVDYHQIPHCHLKELTPESNLLDLAEKQDFSSIYKGHKERFEHYLEFLHKNGLKTVYDYPNDASVNAKKLLKSYSENCVLLPKDCVDKKEKRKRVLQRTVLYENAVKVFFGMKTKF